MPTMINYDHFATETLLTMHEQQLENQAELSVKKQLYEMGLRQGRLQIQAIEKVLKKRNVAISQLPIDKQQKE